MSRSVHPYIFEWRRTTNFTTSYSDCKKSRLSESNQQQKPGGPAKNRTHQRKKGQRRVKRNTEDHRLQKITQAQRCPAISHPTPPDDDQQNARHAQTSFYNKKLQARTNNAEYETHT